AHDHPHVHVHVGAGSTGSHTSHRHPHRHVAPMPDDPFMAYGGRTAFFIGLLHGVGAETPSQVLVFLAAAGVGGKAAGVAVLAAFLFGLLSSNTLVGLAGTYGFLGSPKNWPL